jgi:hypothetical protein
MTEILYAPHRERVVTTNAWAFLHWLRTAYDVDLADWAALQRFSAERANDFRAAVMAFARLPDGPIQLVREGAPAKDLVLRRADGARLPFNTATPPAEIAASLARLWPPALLVRPLADLLLHADIRPDDRLLTVGPAWPWLVALLQGTALTLAAAPANAVLSVAADERATVLIAPAQLLAEAAFQRARKRPDLAALRTIVATGGPLSPEGRRRIYTWVKSDLMLLARTGDTLWGNPLEPVLIRPSATPALLTPPASAPATR